MKRDDKQNFLKLDVKALNTKLIELAKEISVARQNGSLQDKTKVDVKIAYKLRKQMKLIKAELTRRMKETV
jgi:hypothetical protein